MTKRTIAILVVLAILGGFVAGCNGSTQSNPQASAPKPPIPQGQVGGGKIPGKGGGIANPPSPDR